MTATVLAPPVDDATRRQFLTGTAAVALLASCGRDNPAAPAPPAGDGFPVTIEHKYGRTVIPTEPKRVVTVGFVDHDAVLALGVAPVGVGTDEATSPGQPFGIYPWAQKQLGDAAPRQLGYLTTNVEAIAALRPDLILGVSSGLTEQEYRLMDAVAPTVAQPAEYPDFFMPWPELTRTVGRALGRAEQAEQLVAGVQERFARARREHPEFAGRSVAYAGVLTDGGYYVEASASPRVSILTALGFTVPAEIDDLVGELTFTEISEERLRLLDREVLLWEIGSAGQREAG